MRPWTLETIIHKTWCENVIKNVYQNAQKSVPALQKNPPKSTSTPQKICQNPGPAASRTRVGQSIEKGSPGIMESGGSGPPKTAPWRLQNSFKKQLNVCSYLMCVFTRFWSPFGCRLGTSWGRLWLSRWLYNAIPKAIVFWMSLGIWFWQIFIAFRCENDVKLAWKWNQKSILS